MTGPAPTVAAGRTLILGGARSGKSAFGETLIRNWAGDVDRSSATPARIDYVATASARPDDAEWQARIEAHRRRRPAGWTTIETTDLVRVFTGPGGAVLLDSLTAWLTAMLDDCGAWSDAAGWRGRLDTTVDRTVSAWAASPRVVVAVSDEVGGGLVPETASGRLFRDELGLLNQRFAAAADSAWLVTAGLPQRLK